VHRLGFGAMRLTGEGIWGRQEIGRFGASGSSPGRRSSVSISSIPADSYGPYISEELIAEALFPYPAGLVICNQGRLETVPARISGPTMQLPRTFARRSREASRDCA